MRISELELEGKRHILCLNLWALKRIYAHWGEYGSALRAISEGSPLERTGEQFVMLHILLHGGAIYAAEMGMKNPEPPEMTEMVKDGLEEILPQLMPKLLEALERGMSGEIKIQRDAGDGKTGGALAAEWYLWYGLKIGLSYREAHALPLGELLDLISVEQIKHEGAKLQQSAEDDFWALLERR